MYCYWIEAILLMLFVCWSVFGAMQFMEIIFRYKLSIKAEFVFSILCGPISLLIFITIYCIGVPLDYINKKFTKYLNDNYKKRD